jgi:methylenetetrahydrofolate reductase (NADPH)
MKADSRLAEKIAGKEFIFTAEYLPTTDIDPAALKSCAKFFNGVAAVNVADNHYGVGVSSLAASVALGGTGLETVYQLVTRDRNRIALQSDLLGAALLGIKNVLCLSGYHQTLIGNPQSANVFDIDSIQLLALVKKMNAGQLMDGSQIKGKFSMLVGAAASPYLKPVELNMLRLGKKIAAGSDFLQTQAVFDVPAFKEWLSAAHQKGFTAKAAFLAGVMPLSGAVRAQELAEKHTDIIIPPAIIERLKSAGDATAQQKEGLKIAAETIKQLKGLPGLKGVHIFSGGWESVVPELLAAV